MINIPGDKFDVPMYLVLVIGLLGISGIWGVIVSSFLLFLLVSLFLSWTKQQNLKRIILLLTQLALFVAGIVIFIFIRKAACTPCFYSMIPFLIMVSLSTLIHLHSYRNK